MEASKKLQAKHTHGKDDADFWRRYSTHQASFNSATEPAMHWGNIRDNMARACESAGEIRKFIYDYKGSDASGYGQIRDDFEQECGRVGGDNEMQTRRYFMDRFHDIMEQKRIAIETKCNKSISRIMSHKIL